MKSKNLKNNFILLKNICKFDNIGIEDETNIYCRNIRDLHYSHKFDIYEIVNAISKEGQEISTILGNSTSFYDIYNKILLNKENLADIISKSICKFIKKYAVPYAINIEQLQEEYQQATNIEKAKKQKNIKLKERDLRNDIGIRINIIEYVRDCLVIYNLISIFKTNRNILKVKYELEKDKRTSGKYPKRFSRIN